MTLIACDRTGLLTLCERVGCVAAVEVFEGLRCELGLGC